MAKRRFYACVDPINPEPAGVCDRGGEVRPLRDLKPEMVWVGNRLAPNGFLCCDRHRDVPNEQGRAFHIPADPVPVRNPRPQKAMTPLLGVVTDNDAISGVQTAGYVLDGNNRPIMDGSPYFPLSQLEAGPLGKRWMRTDHSGLPIYDHNSQVITTGPFPDIDPLLKPYFEE